MRPEAWLARVRPAAADILAQGRKITHLVETTGRVAARALDRYPGFARVMDDLDTALRLMKAYGQGKYHAVPYRSMLALVAALVYLVSPLDAIPDLLVTLGFIDDLAVLTLVISQIRHDLARFETWEQTQSENEPPVRALPHPAHSTSADRPPE
ncbi:MAG: YkvA family protein [Pseudomonadota bacterium]